MDPQGTMRTPEACITFSSWMYSNAHIVSHRKEFSAHPETSVFSDTALRVNFRITELPIID